MAAEGLPARSIWYIVLVMEGMLAAMIGFVGALLSVLLMWIRSDIKSISTTLTEHGQRLARIETILGALTPGT